MEKQAPEWYLTGDDAANLDIDLMNTKIDQS